MNEERDLAKAVWSEAGLTELLGCNRRQLRRLTLEAGLPGVRLQTGIYVYLAEDVLQWLTERRTGSGQSVGDAETPVSTP